MVGLVIVAVGGVVQCFITQRDTAWKKWQQWNSEDAIQRSQYFPAQMETLQSLSISLEFTTSLEGPLENALMAWISLLMFINWPYGQMKLFIFIDYICSFKLHACVMCNKFSMWSIKIETNSSYWLLLT